jgi:hypothetical protein
MCLAESPHPYENNMDQIWVVDNPDTSAQATRVHFSRVELERNYDYIILKDGTGYEYQRITGTYSEGLWSNAVPGRTVMVHLKTDHSITKWGFCLNRVETTALPPTPTPTRTPCSCHGQCTCVGHCSCHGQCTCVGYHCTCVPVHYWYPC